MRILEVTYDSDYPVRAWHLELQVRIAWDHNELGKRRSAKEGVIGPSKGDNLEAKCLSPKILLCAEDDLQRDATQWLGLLSRYDAMEVY